MSAFDQTRAFRTAHAKSALAPKADFGARLEHPLKANSDIATPAISLSNGLA